MKTIADVPCFLINPSLACNRMIIVSPSFSNDGRVDNYEMVIAADGIHSGTRRMIFDKK